MMHINKKASATGNSKGSISKLSGESRQGNNATATLYDAIEAFKQVLADNGLGYLNDIKVDAGLQRFKLPDEKGNNRSGWYTFHSGDICAGGFGNWKTGLNETWHFKQNNKPLTPAERQALAIVYADAKKKREAETQKRYAESRRISNGVWNKAQPAKSDHPYLVKKHCEGASQYLRQDETGLHFETWNIRSRGFKNWASHLFYTTHETTPSDSGISEAIDTLSGLGQFEGEEFEVNLRYAFHDEKIYIDLGCDHWKIIEVSTEGYKVIESQNAPVKFMRSNIFRPLPLPKQGKDIALLWDHLNIESRDGRFLILAYILEAMRVNRPYPVLEIGGEQGSAKSTFQKRLREIIDPNKVDLRSAPRSVEDIFVATRNNHIISYNNLSHLTANTQDAFCTLSTGGGDATRKLYSTSEEEAWEAMRPIMMNGISMLATRPDLADRTVALELPRVKTYITEAELKESWEKDLPLILGAIYNLLAKTLAELPAVTIDKPPRMADFARLGQAMLNAQGIDESFTEIYMRNRNRVVLRAIESSPVAQAIIKLVDEDIFYKGTKGGLMDRLIHHQPKHFDRANYPKSVKGLADALRRLAPALRVQGIEVIEDKKRYKDGYRVEIRKINTASPKPDKTEIEL